MVKIVCGWCGKPTGSETTSLETPVSCESCGHANPAQPWEQRGERPPMATAASESGGRPRLDPSQVRERLRIAMKELGPSATNAQLAEHLDIGETTLRSWRKVAGL